MEKSATRTREKFQLRTKNCCLFCLEDVGEGAPCSNISVLLEHLGINVSDVMADDFGNSIPTTSKPVTQLTNSEMGVQLCKGCEDFSRRATGQIRFVAMIQKSLGNNLDSIREAILKTNGNQDGVGKYEKWTGTDSGAFLDENGKRVRYLRERLQTECFRLAAKAKLEAVSVLGTSLPQLSSDDKGTKENSSVNEKSWAVVEVTCEKSSVTRRGPKKRKCNVCQKWLNSFTKLQSHRKSVHSKDTHRCAICEEIFDENVALKNHKREAHNDNITESTHCEEVGCGKVYPTKSHLIFHNQLCHVNEVEADSTDSGYPPVDSDCADGTAQSFLANMKKSSTVNKTSTTYEKTSVMSDKRDESSVKDSIVSIMDIDDVSDVEMEDCTPGTSTQLHTLDKVKSDLECPNCYETFSHESKAKYEDHIQKCSDLPEEMPSLKRNSPILERPSCSKELNKSSSLKVKGKPSQSKASFKVTKSTLNQQTTRKNDAKKESLEKYPCPHCQIFFTNSTLKKHKKHCFDRGSRWIPHRCKIVGCSHVYSTQVELNKHLQTHPKSFKEAIPENPAEPTKSPPSIDAIDGVFVCGHCKGEFQTERLLHNHRKRNHGSPCLQNCEFCKK